MGVCQSSGDRCQYSYGANSNVLPMWDFNLYDNSSGSWVRSPGRPAIRASRITRFDDQTVSATANALPAGKIMLYDRLRSDRMDTWFSSIDNGGVSFHHPHTYPKPPATSADSFTRAVIGRSVTHAAFADGHVAPVSPTEFPGKL